MKSMNERSPWLLAFCRTENQWVLHVTGRNGGTTESWEKRSASEKRKESLWKDRRERDRVKRLYFISRNSTGIYGFMLIFLLKCLLYIMSLHFPDITFSLTQVGHAFILIADAEVQHFLIRYWKKLVIILNWNPVSLVHFWSTNFGNTEEWQAERLFGWKQNLFIFEAFILVVNRKYYDMARVTWQDRGRRGRVANVC